MAKNTLVLTGSPRKNGNSERLADAFIKGAQSAGNKVTKFETAMKDIKGCKACKSCWTKGKACIYTDGFSELEPLLEDADVIVFATPLYFFSMSAQIKLAIDKFNSYLSDNCPKPLHIKESALLICGADDNIGGFSGAFGMYKNIVDYMQWNDLGVIAVTNVDEKGDIDNTESLKEAEELGKSV